MLALTTLSALPPAGATADNPFLSFDMPYGGCRLLVRGDGSGTLGYGAVPQQVAVQTGSFDLAALRARFAANDFEREYAQTIFKFCAPALNADAVHR